MWNREQRISLFIQSKYEKQKNKRLNTLCYVCGIDVLLQINYGIPAKCTSTRYVYNASYSDISPSRANTHILIRIAKRTVRGLQSLVVPIPLYLDFALGSNYAHSAPYI